MYVYKEKSKLLTGWDVGDYIVEYYRGLLRGCKGLQRGCGVV